MPKYLSEKVRAVVYSFLSFDELLDKISKLSTKKHYVGKNQTLLKGASITLKIGKTRGGIKENEI